MNPSRHLELLRKEQDSWLFFTRKREYDKGNLDEHGRYIFDGSVEGDISFPRISSLWASAGFSPSYPEGKQFAIVLTHDVDLLYPSKIRSIISSSKHLVRGELAESLKYLNWSRKGVGASPYFNFDKIIKLEEEFNARSTFFFLMSEKDFTGSGYSHEDIEGAILEVKKKGWEVGLHGSYQASESLPLMVKEKKELEEILGESVKGYRNHYLRIKVPLTWRHLEEAGFHYDSTLGYAEHYGFRNGMAYPFHPYDLEAEREIGIYELPLALMDCTLYQYMGLSPSEAKEAIVEMISRVENVRGALIVLWHNDVLADPGMEEWARLYRFILQEGKRKNAWMCSAGELVEWWSRNES